MIEPTVPPLPPVTPDQQANQSSAADQVVEAGINLAVEGGVEAITQSGDFVGGAVAAGVEVVGSLIGGIFEGF